VHDRFDDEAFQAARAVCLELFTVLGSYSHALVLVGGMAPYFLVDPSSDAMLGRTFDIDVGVDRRAVDEDAYARMEDLLTSRGYVRAAETNGLASRFRWIRTVRAGTREIAVAVDFLGVDDGVAGRRDPHQTVQGNLEALSAAGIEQALRDASEHTIEGQLPDGQHNKLVLRCTGIAGFITMKAHALSGRLKEKDAFDIVTVLAATRST